MRYLALVAWFIPGADQFDMEFGELGGTPVHAVFLHANPRHHSLAFAQATSPKRLHHFMLQVNALDDLGATFDRCQDAGVPILYNLGRHQNDRMISFYGITPSGFAFEIGWGARKIDDADWQVRTYPASAIGVIALRQTLRGAISCYRLRARMTETATCVPT